VKAKRTRVPERARLPGHLDQVTNYRVVSVVAAEQPAQIQRCKVSDPDIIIRDVYLPCGPKDTPRVSLTTS
jgi:hypothetical protein